VEDAIEQIKLEPLSLMQNTWHSIFLGDLMLFMQHNDNELLIAFEYQSKDSAPLYKALEAIGSFPEAVELKERIYLGNEEDITFQFQLADKPYQVKADTPIRIGPKGRLVLYVSTPLWIQIKSLASETVISEYPAVLPQLSWVGSNTTEGDLCYSTKTTAPSEFEEVNRHAHRAVTALEIINDSSNSLTIERLSLPLNILNLFFSTDLGYWTESVRFRFDSALGETTVVTSQRPPEEIGECKKVTIARNTGKPSRFRTAMNLIMG
jgi:hypothetical protein